VTLNISEQNTGARQYVPQSPMSLALTSDPPKSRRAVVTMLGIIMLAAAVAQAFGRFTFGVLLPDIREDLLDGSNTLAGLLGTANTFAYLTGALVLGSSASLLSPVNWVRLGLVLSVSGISLAVVAPTGAILALALVLMGLGGAAIWIPSPGLAVSVLSPQRRGLGAGMMGSGIGIGLVFSGQLNNIVSDQGRTWRTVYGVESLIGVAALLLALLVLSSPTKSNPMRGGFGGFGVLSRMNGWKPLTLCYAVFGFGYLLVIAFLVARLTDDNNYSAGRASTVFAILGACTVFGGMGWGRLSDVIGRRAALIAGYIGFSSGTLLLATGNSTLTIVGAVMCGVLFGGIPTVITAYIIDRTDPTSYGPSYAAATFAFGVAQVASPQVGGILADWQGSFTGVFLLSAAVMATGSLAAMALPRDHHVAGSVA